jgi:hypothetical protein
MNSLFFRAAFLAGLGILGLSMGCTSTHDSKPGFAVNAATSARIQADLEIGEMVEGSANATKILSIVLGPTEYADGVDYGATAAPQAGILNAILGGGDSTGDAVKSAAAWNALQPGGYDIILAARYHLVVNDFIVFKSYECTVKGWGAKIKGVKQIEAIR